jgi:hypothetical protein
MCGCFISGCGREMRSTEQDESVFRFFAIVPLGFGPKPSPQRPRCAVHVAVWVNRRGFQKCLRHSHFFSNLGRTYPCALGRPGVTVRAHYGALPSMAGRGQVEGGRKPAGVVLAATSLARKYGPPAQIAAVARRKALRDCSFVADAAERIATLLPPRLSARCPLMILRRNYLQNSGSMSCENANALAV